MLRRLQCAEVQHFGIEYSAKLRPLSFMDTPSRQLHRNRIRVGIIALGLYALGNFGPGIGHLFDSGRHGDQFEDRIDRLAAEAEQAAAFAERAALEAEARADRADF
jgi:hypothetical protein